MSYDLLRFSLLFRRFVIVKEHSVRPLYGASLHESSFTTPPPINPSNEGANPQSIKGLGDSQKAAHKSVRVSQLLGDKFAQVQTSCQSVRVSQMLFTHSVTTITQSKLRTNLCGFGRRWSLNRWKPLLITWNLSFCAGLVVYIVIGMFFLLRTLHCGGAFSTKTTTAFFAALLARPSASTPTRRVLHLPTSWLFTSHLWLSYFTVKTKRLKGGAFFAHPKATTPIHLVFRTT